MPTDLRRYQQAQNFHFITFSCYRRQPFLDGDAARDIVQQLLEQTRQQQKLCIAAYVLMPEHIHLLTDEPAIGTLATFLQIFKQLTSRQLKAFGSPTRNNSGNAVTTTSMSTPKRSASKRSATSTVTRSNADSFSTPKTIAGAASTTTPPENPAWSKSNPNGLHAEANANFCSSGEWAARGFTSHPSQKREGWGTRTFAITSSAG